MNKNVNITFEEGSSPTRVVLVKEDDEEYSPDDAIEMSEELIERHRAAEAELYAVTSVIQAMHEDRMRPYWEARERDRKAIEHEVVLRMRKAADYVTGTCYWHNGSDEYQLSTVPGTQSQVFRFSIRDKCLSRNEWHELFYGAYDQMKLHLTCLAPRYGIKPC